MDAWRERASSAAASASPGLPCASFRAGPGPPRSGRLAHGLGRLRSGFFYLRAGTPTWSQDVDLAANDPITRHTNVAYTLHFYAGTHEQRLRDKATSALSRGLALFVTEWGTCEASGDGRLDLAESQAWIDFMNSNHLSWCNWSLFDKPEAASALRPGSSTSGGWPDSALTDSGRFVKQRIAAGLPGQLSGVVALKAAVNGRFVCAEDAGNAPLVANRSSAQRWEEFEVVSNSAGPRFQPHYRPPTAKIPGNVAVDSGIHTNVARAELGHRRGMRERMPRRIASRIVVRIVVAEAN